MGFDTVKLHRPYHGNLRVAHQLRSHPHAGPHPLHRASLQRDSLLIIVYQCTSSCERNEKGTGEKGTSDQARVDDAALAIIACCRHYRN